MSEQRDRADAAHLKQVSRMWEQWFWLPEGSLVPTDQPFTYVQKTPLPGTSDEQKLDDRSDDSWTTPEKPAVNP